MRLNKIRSAAWMYLRQNLSWIQGLPLVPIQLRPWLLRLFGVRLGARAYIQPHCVFSLGNIDVGSNFAIGVHVYLDGGGELRIGNDVHIAGYARLLTVTHTIQNAVRRRDPTETVYGRVVVGNGVWIGSGVTVLPNVSIGDGCVIGANSLVRDDCLPNGLYAGVPARRIKDLPLN